MSPFIVQYDRGPALLPPPPLSESLGQEIPVLEGRESLVLHRDGSRFSSRSELGSICGKS